MYNFKFFPYFFRLATDYLALGTVATAATVCSGVGYVLVALLSF